MTRDVALPTPRSRALRHAERVPRKTATYGERGWFAGQPPPKISQKVADVGEARHHGPMLPYLQLLGQR